MNGQWIGRYTGSNSGLAIINIDDAGDHYEGMAYLHDDNTGLPSIAAAFTTRDKNKLFQFKTNNILPVNPTTGMPDSWDNVKRHYEGVNLFFGFVDVKGEWNNETLSLTWTTEFGNIGSCILPKSKAELPSEYKAISEGHDWNTYKQYINDKYISDLENRRFIFRGQSHSWRLRTRFHRTGRANLFKFRDLDIPALHKYLSGRIRHLYNLSNPDENGAFYNLVQHHGYPTPLLDWTYSPYIAAFFAYREISNYRAAKALDNDKVRIFVFDQREWRNDFIQIPLIVAPHLHLSVLEFLAIDNERMIPQQSVSTVTNIDDIEDYIKHKEVEKHKQYLTVIDLPIKERTNIMRELSHMGITAGSLLPGLDGACEELRERFFDI